VIDLHCHLLPGIDDGPSSIHDAVRMARVAVEDGTTTVVCTPHRRPRFPNTPAIVRDAVAAFRERLAEEDIALELVTGMEIDIGELVAMAPEERAEATLGDGPWLLVEMPFEGWPLDLARLMTELELQGLRVVLAHPERNSSVQKNPDRVRDLVGRGALVQVNAESITGEFGIQAQHAAERLLRSGYVHVIASDAHTPTRRPPGLRAAQTRAAEVLGALPGDIAWMVDGIPRAIITGDVVRPPRLPGS